MCYFNSNIVTYLPCESFIFIFSCFLCNNIIYICDSLLNEYYIMYPTNLKYKLAFTTVLSSCPNNELK